VHDCVGGGGLQKAPWLPLVRGQYLPRRVLEQLFGGAQNMRRLVAGGVNSTTGYTVKWLHKMQLHITFVVYADGQQYQKALIGMLMASGRSNEVPDFLLPEQQEDEEEGANELHMLD